MCAWCGCIGGVCMRGHPRLSSLTPCASCEATAYVGIIRYATEARQARGWDDDGRGHCCAQAPGMNARGNPGGQQERWGMLPDNTPAYSTGLSPAFMPGSVIQHGLTQARITLLEV